MNDARVDKMIEMLCRFVEDYYVRNTHNGITTAPIAEHALCLMLEAMDEEKFNEAYKKAKIRIEEDKQ